MRSRSTFRRQFIGFSDDGDLVWNPDAQSVIFPSAKAVRKEIREELDEPVAEDPKTGEEFSAEDLGGDSEDNYRIYEIIEVKK